MNKFEMEHREGLARAARQEEANYSRWLKGQRANGRDTRVQPITREERAAFPEVAEDALRAWDQHIVQLIPAPPGMIIRRRYHGDESGELDESPVIALGLQRNGQVIPVEVGSDGITQSNDSLLLTGRFDAWIVLNGKVLAEGEGLF